MARAREREEAVPWADYATPEEVLADRRLSDVEKRTVLESWERHVRERPADGAANSLETLSAALATMPEADGRTSRPGGPRLTSQEARQGEIILKTPTRKAIFIGGIVLVAVVCVFFFYWTSF